MYFEREQELREKVHCWEEIEKRIEKENAVWCGALNTMFFKEYAKKEWLVSQVVCVDLVKGYAFVQYDGFYPTYFVRLAGNGGFSQLIFDFVASKKKHPSKEELKFLAQTVFSKTQLNTNGGKEEATKEWMLKMSYNLLLCCLAFLQVEEIANKIALL